MNAPEQSGVPAHLRLVQMATGYRVSRALYVAAELGLADRLAEAPRAAEDLAKEADAHPHALYRLMRTLASVGIFTEDGEHRFSLTSLGEALKSGAPGAARGAVRILGGQEFWRAWEHVLHSVQTGGTGWERAWGMGPYEYLSAHPELASRLSEAMVAFHGGETTAVAAAYDFSDIGTLVDVGGATGNMLAAILCRFPQPRGVLFDLPHVVKDAPALLAARGVAHRVEIQGGSFFESVPEGGDAYLLSHVIHNWSEEQCVAILTKCRQAMKPNGRLLLVEMVLPPGDTPHPGKVLDLAMLVQAGGEERTEEQFRALLAKAGFRVARVAPTDSPASIIEGIPASV